MLLLLAVSGCAAVAQHDTGSSDAYGESSPSAEDAVLKEQIARVQKGLVVLNQQISEDEKTLLQETDETKKTALSGKLKDLEKDRKVLEKLHRQLIEEQRAEEEATIDEALERVRDFRKDREETSREDQIARDLKQ